MQYWGMTLVDMDERMGGTALLSLLICILQDCSGQECTVVLLDSEGIDTVTEEGVDDNQIFTLTVLLASVLIYNSGGVPTRHDLNGLEYLFNVLSMLKCVTDVLGHFLFAFG